MHNVSIFTFLISIIFIRNQSINFDLRLIGFQWLVLSNVCKKYQPHRWPIWNFAYDLRSLIPITGKNFKSKGQVEPEFRRGVNVHFTDRSGKVQNDDQLFSDTYQFGWLERFSAKFLEPITLVISHLGFRPPIWTFWSVKFQSDRWPTQTFANNLVLFYTTLGQNFKFLAFVVFEISGLPKPPPPHKKKCFA